MPTQTTISVHHLRSIVRAYPGRLNVCAALPPLYSRESVLELVVATPVFLDLTFVGLESLPALGEEKFAADMVRTPGGGAITAVAASRLGVNAAVAAPLGEDVAGDLVRGALADEGVKWVATRPAPRTPTTVVLPFGGDRAMVTIDPGARAQLADVAAQSPRAVAASLDQLFIIPEGSLGYVTCGDDDSRAYAGRPPAALKGVHALFVSKREALALTGLGTVDDAAAALAELAETVVVTLASEGAMALHDGEVTRVCREPVTEPIDTTGAGDLLAAAYIWADLRGAEPADRLRWAVLYASLAVNTPTGIGGALTEADLVRAGTALDLVAPPLARRARAERSCPLQPHVRRRLSATPVSGSKKCRCWLSTASSISCPSATSRRPSIEAQKRARRSSASSVVSSSPRPRPPPGSRRS